MKGVDRNRCTSTSLLPNFGLIVAGNDHPKPVDRIVKGKRHISSLTQCFPLLLNILYSEDVGKREYHSSRIRLLLVVKEQHSKTAQQQFYHQYREYSLCWENILHFHLIHHHRRQTSKWPISPKPVISVQAEQWHLLRIRAASLFDCTMLL